MAKKTLILYYSWSGETKKMAEKINSEIKDSELKEVKVSEGTLMLICIRLQISH